MTQTNLISLRKLILISVCVYVLQIHSVSCFNLENRLPIVKIGEESTYFGYSVAEHDGIHGTWYVF